MFTLSKIKQNGKFILQNIILSGLLLFVIGLFSTTLPVFAQKTDLNLLPYANIFDFLTQGVINGFLIPLAPIVGVLAIVWGGYKYYFGSFTGKEDGLKAIQAGVIGLVIIFGYQIIARFDTSTGEVTGGLLRDTITDQGLDPGALIKFIQETLLNNFLLALSGVVAVAAIVYGGYQYITSPLSKEEGIKTIQNATIGLVIILLATAIKNFIEGTFQNDTINKDPVLNVAKEVITNFLLPLSSVVTLFFIVLAGYQWITAQGDSRKIEDAQNNFRNAVIGFVIVLLSFTITQLIVYIVTNFNIGG